MKRLLGAVLLGGCIGLDAQSPGVRWEPTGGPLIAQQRDILFPAGQMVLVGQDSGWFHSRDQGASWRRQDAQRPWKAACTGGLLFGSTSRDVLRSADAGDSWTPCTALPVDPRGSEITSIAAHERQVYVSVVRVGLFRSEDACDSWAPVRAPWSLDFPPQIGLVNGAVVLVRAIGGWFLSNDAGATWTLLGEPASLAMTFTSRPRRAACSRLAMPAAHGATPDWTGGSSVQLRPGRATSGSPPYRTRTAQRTRWSGRATAAASGRPRTRGWQATRS
jgi:photosystem II stability/assembly factor-like uncharacterized protein